MKTILIKFSLLLAIFMFWGCPDVEKIPTVIHLQNTKWKLAGYIAKEDKTLQILEPKDCEECYTLNFLTDTTGVGKSSSNQIIINLNKPPFLQITTMVGEAGKDGYYFYNVLNVITSYTYNNDELKFFYQTDGKEYYLLYKFIGYDKE